ncbi:unnamed protein product [Heligmosomoides polygyrus]|uniref:Endo/exonuclease/phosphatase domain-containing protein n=1 Tax=Heligmosomoides polygyrus TaxID=6339 RepID=A0A183GAP0_HELPZ|nr:unnamed protein product [Heligmosomoides polygyrus]
MEDGYSCHGGFGYGSRNADGERILEYAESQNLTIVNIVFRKHDSHLILFYSRNTRTQIDFVLVKNRNRCLVTDAKVVPYETVAPHEREGSSCDFSRSVTDSHNCRWNLEEGDRRDTSSCTVGTWHYEA